jgi:hypothetical protein
MPGVYFFLVYGDITMPDMVDMRPGDDVPYFVHPDDVLNQDDIIEADVRVLGWEKKFRIRALTFGQMDKINKNATDPETGNLKMDEWAYWTIVEGVIRPRYRIEQARRLAEANGENVKQLSEQIWELGRLNKKIWDKFIQETVIANKVAKEEFKDLEPNDKEDET